MQSTTFFQSNKAKTIWRNMAVAVFAVAFALLGLCVTIIPTHAADEPDALLVTNPVLIGTAELGEYPQTYVGDELNAILQGLGNDARTGRTYTSTAGGYPGGKIDALKQVTWYEYEYQGRRYVKVDDPSPANEGRLLLPDGPTVEMGKTYFFAVEPIVWDLFRQDDALFAVAREVLGAVSFIALDGSLSDWHDSYLRNFLNTYFMQEAGLTAYAAPRTYYSSTPDSDTAGDLLTDQIWTPSYLEIQNFYATDAERIKCHTGYELMSDNDSNNGMVPFGADYYVTRTINPTDHNAFAKVRDSGIVYTVGGRSVIEGFVPAFVLNETAFTTLFTPATDMVVEYDSTDHTLVSQTTKPAWYNDAMTITYTKDNEPVSAVRDVGEYDVTIALANFTHDYQITVNPRKVIISGSVTAGSRTYDRTTKTTINHDGVKVAGLIDGDNVEVKYAGFFADKNVGKDKPVTVAVSLSGVKAKNYALIDPEFTATADITEQTVVVDGVTVMAKEYDGTTRAMLNTQHLNFTGKLPGDDLTVAVSGEYAQSDVGNGIKVTFVYLLDGEDKNNYRVGGTTTPDTTSNITERLLTVTINDQTVKVGDPLNLTARVTSGSLASGDTANAVYALFIDVPSDPDADETAEPIDPDNLAVGEYTVKGECINDNYDITFVDGKYTVLTTEAWDALQTKDDEEPKDSNAWLIIIIVMAVAAFIGALVGIGLVMRSHDKNREPKPEKPKKEKKDKSKATDKAENAYAKAQPDVKK